MKTTPEFRKAVHEIMIEMAIDNNFPLDISELCLNTIFEKAETKLKKDEDYQNRVLAERLGEFIYYSNFDEMDNNIEVWKTLTSRNDNDMADDHFTMVQHLENSLTIKQLTELL